MTFRRWPAALVLLYVAMAAPASLSSRAATPNVAASRYDVTIDLRADGSLDVVERITLKVGSTPITSFERRVPDRHTDGLTNVVALMDGRPVRPLADGLGVRVRERSGIDARWQFEPIANRERTFELRYRAARVVSREPTGPHLQWMALPLRHDYPIDAARVLLRAPGGTLAVAVSADGGDIQPATSWQDGLVVTGSRLGANDNVALDVTFSADTFRPVEPAWTVAAEHAQKLAPAFIAGGITMLVIGAGTLLMIRVRTSRTIEPGVASWPPGPSDLAPGVATALINRGHTRWGLPLAAAVHDEMMARGLLDADRVSTSRGLTAAGVVLLLLSLAAAGAIAAWLVDRLGPALLAMPAGVFVDAIAFLIAGRAMSNLSASGVRAAARCRAR